ncbi:Uncharacterised protein [Actinobacillus pleuropneumoniae]|nr:Uncharacterised protein [Actinobacillus pleuropneumoniae]
MSLTSYSNQMADAIKASPLSSQFKVLTCNSNATSLR